MKFQVCPVWFLFLSLYLYFYFLWFDFIVNSLFLEIKIFSSAKWRGNYQNIFKCVTPSWNQNKIKITKWANMFYKLQIAFIFVYFTPMNVNKQIHMQLKICVIWILIFTKTLFYRQNTNFELSPICA